MKWIKNLKKIVPFNLQEYQNKKMIRKKQKLGKKKKKNHLRKRNRKKRRKRNHLNQLKFGFIKLLSTIYC